MLHHRDVAAGKRKIILASDAKHFWVPMYEDLDKEDMLLFAATYPEVMRALPIVEHERLKLHRSFIACIIFTIVGQPFRD